MGISTQEMNMMIEKLLKSRDSNTYDALDRKIKVLHNTAWRDKWQWESDQYSKWLGNFSEGEEQLIAMYMLSKFMYFDNETIRELMVRIYEDLYKRPIVYEIRKNNGETKDMDFIESEFEKIRAKTRFLSIGNPSESSAHLLYFFRQENYLKRDLFIGPHELFVHNENGEIITAKLAIDGIDRIVVLDDFCGSGNQATRFNNEFVKFIKEKNRDIHISYFALFAIEEGLEKVDNLSFDVAKSVFVLDKSYKCFSDESRFFDDENASLKEACKLMCEKYGKQISKIPMGYNDCQMLLGFHHNTPNNTLPIFWKEKDGWVPMFKRFAKLY
jgi:hypothetical protein